MNTIEWQHFLKEASRQIIADNLCETSDGVSELWQHSKLSIEAVQSEWLGEEGATESQLQATEERLGIALPASYRNFLSVTNGWNDWQVGPPRLYSAEEICWFRDENQDSIDIWEDSDYGAPPVSDEKYFVYGEMQQPSSMRVEYLKSALQISATEEGSVVLLNPKVIIDGEWEAWLFANHFAGAKRYRTFADMVESHGFAGAWF
jgi:hypothetical protein